ncbi:phosphodiester glycosidase family protein [Crocosphaera sp. XPORK-15E]|uniref:phosphodiester glycosidase family protein n=1 Tax=Crocosphaera sp. XPORK-15E TaxID=3110247 RepID=UPI002B215180|nr:phosphodiester glycosidase family protein [Crocosphaera sp. XPORK-15E]MEA5532888.1 phosphodiester glycosidase family protein [Crocosphaera sp. XPORK-15E]
MKKLPWYPLTLFSISLLSTLIIYLLISNSPQSEGQNITFSPQILPVEASDAIPQGKEIILNGKKYNIPWTQWQQGDKIRTGISDIGAMNLLGLELLSTNDPNLQPIRWFGTDSGQPLPILARFIAPYRYLDVTELIQLAGGNLQVINNSLKLNFPLAQISNIRQGNQPWGKRIVLDVDRPTVWQVSQAKGQGVVMISGKTSTASTNDYNSTNLTPNSLNNTDEDDLGSPVSQPSESNLFSLENTENLTKINVNLPTAYGLNVFSLSNPNRIVIDVRSDAIVPKEIVWTPGIIWRQQFVKIKRGLNEDIFPVNWLEIAQRSPHISLKPIISNPNSQTGTAPLVTTAQNWQASAAINGGFFNRNNQLPLGAIRQDNKWLSSPILGRGAIAWNERGQVNMNRLSFRENLITSARQTLPILFLNSGYVQSGIARYTPEWGENYTTLSDNETIVFVQNNQIIEQKKAVKAGNNTFPIPTNGYLLIIRKNAVSPSSLSVGMTVKIESNTIPTEFNQFSHIVGAGPLLINNRRIVVNAEAENFSKGFQQQKASRSAIGVTNRGTIMLVAVHTRVGGSGASLDEMAQIMQQLGAVDALNLDGGSSTSLALGGQLIDRSPVTAARVHNGIGVFVNP